MFHALKNKIASIKRKHKFTKFYKQFIQKGDLCFDIGANIGHRTGIFNDLGASVIAIEPVQESIKLLQQNFNQNDNIIILKAAVGSKPGESNIHISNELEVCTLSENFIKEYKDQPGYDLRWEEIRTIKIITVDQLIEEHGIPAFCKIDVEGFELEVLKGLSQPLPSLSFEYNAKLKSIALDCIDNLERFDALSFNFSPYEKMVFSFESWQNQTRFREYILGLPDSVQTGDIYVMQN